MTVDHFLRDRLVVTARWDEDSPPGLSEESQSEHVDATSASVPTPGRPSEFQVVDDESGRRHLGSDPLTPTAQPVKVEYLPPNIIEP